MRVRPKPPAAIPAKAIQSFLIIRTSGAAISSCGLIAATHPRIMPQAKGGAVTANRIAALRIIGVCPSKSP